MIKFILNKKYDFLKSSNAFIVKALFFRTPIVISQSNYFIFCCSKIVFSSIIHYFEFDYNPSLKKAAHTPLSLLTSKGIFFQ